MVEQYNMVVTVKAVKRVFIFCSFALSAHAYQSRGTDARLAELDHNLHESSARTHDQIHLPQLVADTGFGNLTRIRELCCLLYVTGPDAELKIDVRTSMPKHSLRGSQIQGGH